MNFDASQVQVPQPQQEQQQQRVNLAMIPENDFSKLNINGFNSMNYNNFHSVNAFAVTELPDGPDPVDLLTESRARLPASTTTDCASNLTVLLAKLDGTARHMRPFGPI